MPPRQSPQRYVNCSNDQKYIGTKSIINSTKRKIACMQLLLQLRPRLQSTNGRTSTNLHFYPLVTLLTLFNQQYYMSRPLFSNLITENLLSTTSHYRPLSSVPHRLSCSVFTFSMKRLSWQRFAFFMFHRRTNMQIS